MGGNQDGHAGGSNIPGEVIFTIYVLTYPETILERIKFQLFKICPSIPCSYIRNGPGVVECITGEDSCQMVPLNGVMRIVWESGYKEALSQARKEYFDGVAQSMQQMAGAPAGCSCGDEDEDCDCGSGSYTPTGTAVDGYS